jgi:hypothetical protein
MDRDPCGDSICVRLGLEFGLLEPSEKVRNLAGEYECEYQLISTANSSGSRRGAQELKQVQGAGGTNIGSG